jgi:hypothetical protein
MMMLQLYTAKNGNVSCKGTVSKDLAGSGCGLFEILPWHLSEETEECERTSQ